MNLTPKDKNHKLAVVCALVSLVGIFIMFISNSIADVPHPKISEITKEMTGERVVLCGTVKTKSDNGKGTTFITLNGNSSSISVVFFKDVKELASRVKTKSDICIEGNIQVYNGDTELVARKLVNS